MPLSIYHLYLSVDRSVRSDTIYASRIELTLLRAAFSGERFHVLKDNQCQREKNKCARTANHSNHEVCKVVGRKI